MDERFILVNGKISDTEKNPDYFEFCKSNIFRLEEAIWFCHGQIPLFEEHLILLNDQVKKLNAPLPEFLADKNELKRLTERLINKNRAFNSGIIWLSIILRQTNSDYILTIEPLQAGHLELKQDGLLVGYSEEIKFSENKLNPYRFFNVPLWNQINFRIINNRQDGILIINEKRSIVEFPGANIFFIKDESLITPSVETGCFLDPIREKILETAMELDYKIIEPNKLNDSHVVEMDEAFIAGECTAMQKIMGIGNKRFTHSKTALINKQLNRKLLEI